MPKVGIYFFIDGKIIIHAVPVEQGIPYGTAIQYGDHFDFWNNFVPKNKVESKFKKNAYDAYPRGRVVYFQGTKVFCFYQDKCLSDEDRALIMKEFELKEAEIRYDEHYQCAQCNRNFIDIV